MKLYRLTREQTLPIGIDEAWSFFSDPRNLSEITPPNLGLRVTSDLPPRMHQGMIISYRLHPLFGIRLGWVTEITHVDEPESFVDEQRFGPYRFWHHLHRFEEVEGGTAVHDIVHYALPFAFIGRVCHGPFVRTNLERIFDYRRKVLRDRFGTVAGREDKTG